VRDRIARAKYIHEDEMASFETIEEDLVRET